MGAATALWIAERNVPQALAFNSASARASENARYRVWFLSLVPRTEHFTRNYPRGVSHTKWPKDNRERAPTETSSVICWTFEAVDLERRPPRADRLSKRPKKLRAVSGARPR